MTLLFFLLLFFFGAILGSFAGVIIERGRGGFEFARLPEILGGRSYCPGCITKEAGGKKMKSDEAKQLQKKYTLSWRQLIPLFGRIIQGGKCYRCKTQIPVWYMSFEMVMGLAFVVTALLLPGFNVGDMFVGGVSWWQLLFWIPIVRASVGIFVADVLWYELNVWLRLFLMIWIIAWGATGYFDLQAGLIWMFILFAIYVAIYWFGKRYVRTIFQQEGEGFGQGDVMLAATIGLLFPFVLGGLDRVGKVQMVMLYLVASSLIGMVFRYVRFLITQEKDNMMPFLPAMMVGFVFVLVRGIDLIGIL